MTEAAAIDQPDLSVDPLKARVGQAPLDRGHDTVEMGTQPTGQVHERSEPTADRAFAPRLEVAPGVDGADALVQGPQLLLELPGAEQLAAEAADLVEQGALGVSKALRPRAQRAAHPA